MNFLGVDVQVNVQPQRLGLGGKIPERSTVNMNCPFQLLTDEQTEQCIELLYQLAKNFGPMVVEARRRSKT